VALHRSGAGVTRRFYVDAAELAGGETIAIEGVLAHRLAKVLRARAGEEIVLFAGDGNDVRVRIDEINERRALASVLERLESPPESRVRISLYQSITKGDRFEWLLEKGTEIGVARFVPLLTARAVVKPEAGGNRAERWRRIVIEAAEQSGRGAVPTVEPPQRLADALASAPGVLLLPYESADERTPDVQAALNADIDALFAFSEVSVFIGPEGGYEEAEVVAAREAGATVVTMGRRVLRSETAGLVAATLVMQATGELG
jgi:16S rRNA (uracil1498-N3)-methyltransferase